MFDLEKIKSSAILCKTENEYRKLYNFFKKEKFDVPNESIWYNLVIKDFCFRLDKKFVRFSNKKYYERNGFKILSFEEVVLNDTIQKKIVSRKRRVKFLKKV